MTNNCTQILLKLSKSFKEKKIALFKTISKTPFKIPMLKKNLYTIIYKYLFAYRLLHVPNYSMRP